MRVLRNKLNHKKQIYIKMNVQRDRVNNSTGFCEVIVSFVVVGAGIALYANSKSSPVMGQVGQALGNYVVESQNDPAMNLLGSLANIFPTAALVIGSAALGGMAVAIAIIGFCWWQMMKATNWV